MTTHVIPVGRPQPKLSRLLAKEIAVTEIAHSEIEKPQHAAFWDLQQVLVPAEFCDAVLDVLDSLCSQLGVAQVTVVTEVPATTQRGLELLSAFGDSKHVQLLTFLEQHGQPSGTAAEFELKRVRLRHSCYHFFLMVLGWKHAW